MPVAQAAVFWVVRDPVNLYLLFVRSVGSVTVTVDPDGTTTFWAAPLHVMVDGTGPNAPVLDTVSVAEGAEFIIEHLIGTVTPTSTFVFPVLVEWYESPA